MRRTFLALTIFFSAGLAQAGPVDDARLDYIAGNYVEAIKVLMPAAVAGDANAQNIMGAAFDDGNGVTQNYSRAVEWWEKAAAQDFSKALYNLGEFWLNGRPGIEPDYPKAYPLFERAAKQDNADAIGNMGFMREQGLGVEADLEMAVALYMRADELGAIFATGNLGSLYAQGKGVEKDYVLAFAYMTKAAEAGDAASFSNLGVMFELGYNVAANKLAAFTFYGQAMALGDARGANNLASLMLEDGYFWSDRVDALAHCLWSRENTVSEQAYEDFEIDCDELAGTLTEEGRGEAEARLRDL